jgi:hypothetical protein
MIDFLGLLYDVATSNIADLLVMLLIVGFLVYVIWESVKAIFFSRKDKK